MILANVFGLTESELGIMIPIIALGGGFVCAIVGIIASSITKAKTTRAREESRREIAAYVAEGTISPDDAAKILNAGTWAGHIDQIKQKLRG